MEVRVDKLGERADKLEIRAVKLGLRVDKCSTHLGTTVVLIGCWNLFPVLFKGGLNRYNLNTVYLRIKLDMFIF